MPAHDVAVAVDTVAIRYRYADGREHIWTTGAGWVKHTVRMLSNDPGNPTVEPIRWDGTAWVIVDDKWLFGDLLGDDELFERYRLEEMDRVPYPGWDENNQAD